jgi:acyl-CoA reductase-like NAD-dependent aldehyde dehydrogenase
MEVEESRQDEAFACVYFRRGFGVEFRSNAFDAVVFDEDIDERFLIAQTRIANDETHDRFNTLLAGGERLGNHGYYFPLTVLADVPDDARAMREEPFGPLALINPVSPLDEAIEKANALPYGLAAYAFTRSARNADQLAEGVEVGNLSINILVASIAEIPFGGIKESGYGREGGTEGLSHYTVVKNVSHVMM